MRHAMSIERSGHTSLDRREAPHMDAGPHGRSSRNYAFLVSMAAALSSTTQCESFPHETWLCCRLLEGGPEYVRAF